ncbi:MAG: AEC family transporter [Halanaerobiales bacterium]|nr:AEC family transporter [Halanaerobiales bacterium]
MAFNIIISQIISLFLLIFLGYILRKKDFINDKLNKGLSLILVDIALPALIISSMTVKINSDFINYVKTFTIITFLIYFSITLISVILAKFLNLSIPQDTVFKFLIILGNVGYMGLPIISAVFADKWIILNIINIIFFNILVWTYGVYLFKRTEENFKLNFKNMLNNGVIAIIIGFILLFTGYKPPLFITSSLEMLGDITFPISMLVIGSSLVSVDIKKIFMDKNLISATFIKLILYPLLTLLILSFFELNTVIYQISVILVAVPSGAQVVLFAEKFDGDYKFAAEGVFMTTLFSLFTIPLFLYLVTII